MNRRHFFRRLGIGTGVACLNPVKLLSGLAVSLPVAEDFTLVGFDYVRKPLKLKAIWSEEAAQDLQAMHNIKAEEQLTRALSENYL